MVSWDTLGAHGIALLLIWSAVLLPGLALLPYLRVGIGLAGAPVLGFIYWTISLYLLPFAHGLDIAPRARAQLHLLGDAVASG